MQKSAVFSVFADFDFTKKKCYDIDILEKYFTRIELYQLAMPPMFWNQKAHDMEVSENLKYG